MKPILFNTEMVRAILDDRKTATRRLAKTILDFKVDEGVIFSHVRTNHFNSFSSGSMKLFLEKYAPYQLGDILYVRETWKSISAWSGTFSGCEIEYKAGGTCKFNDIIAIPNIHKRWRPSIHMPKEAARLFLRVKEVRVERLQDITDAPPGTNNPVCKEGFQYQCDFIATWNSTIKKSDIASYGWEANPWVWVIEFERISKEEAYAEKK